MRSACFRETNQGCLCRGMRGMVCPSEVISDESISDEVASYFSTEKPFPAYLETDSGTLHLQAWI